MEDSEGARYPSRGCGDVKRRAESFGVGVFGLATLGALFFVGYRLDTSIRLRQFAPLLSTYQQELWELETRVLLYRAEQFETQRLLQQLLDSLSTRPVP